MHKVAMVLAASYKDERIIVLDDLQLADQMLTAIEGCLDKVFAQIGRTEQSRQAEQFIAQVVRRGRVPYDQAYRLVHTHFPDLRDYEGILQGAIRSGQLLLQMEEGVGMVLAAPPLSDNNRPPEQPSLPSAKSETSTPNT
jgi:hypothetical protein